MPLALAMRCLSKPRSSGPVPVCLTSPVSAISWPIETLKLRLRPSSAAIAALAGLFSALSFIRNGLLAGHEPNPRSIESP